MMVTRALAPPRSSTHMLAFWTILFSMFIFSGYRYWVGCDWFGYLNQYSIQWNEGYDDAIIRRDPAHWLLMEFLQQNGFGFFELNLVTTFLFLFGLQAFARRQVDPLGFLVLAFPILIINMPMSAIRQAVAIGFLCLALTAFIDRRAMRFMAFLSLGGLFHSSAFLFFVFVPFIHGAYSNRNILMAMALIAPGLFFLASTDSAEVATGRYIAGDIDAAGAMFRASLLIITGLIFLLVLRKPWKKIFPQDYKLASISAAMMMTLVPLILISSVIADRIGYYLIPAQLMIFTRMPYLVQKTSKGFFQMLPYAMLTLTFVVWTQKSAHFDKCYLPYESALKFYF